MLEALTFTQKSPLEIVYSQHSDSSFWSRLLHTHTRTHTHTHTHTHTYTLTHTYTHTRTHTHTYIHTHSHIHTHTHIHTHSHIHTHTHIHTHAHMGPKCIHKQVVIVCATDNSIHSLKEVS